MDGKSKKKEGRNTKMEPNVNEMVEEMVKVNPEQLAEANDQLLTKAIAETLSETAKVPANNAKWALIGAGAFLGGTAAGVAIDRWVIPAIGKAFNKAKEARAKKKAEKKARKAAKEVKVTIAPAPEAPVTDDGIDPTTVNPEIKD